MIECKDKAGAPTDRHSVVQMSIPSMSSIVVQIVTLWLVYHISSFVIKLYRVRSKFQKMQKESFVSHQQDRRSSLLVD